MFPLVGQGERTREELEIPAQAECRQPQQEVSGVQSRYGLDSTKARSMTTWNGVHSTLLKATPQGLMSALARFSFVSLAPTSPA